VTDKFPQVCLDLVYFMQFPETDYLNLVYMVC